MDHQITALATVTRLVTAAKAWAAALSVAVPGIGVFIANTIESGNVDGTELRILLASAALAVFVGGVTHQTPAGDAEVALEPGSIEVPDDHVPDELHDPEEVQPATADGGADVPEGDVTKFGSKE